MPSYYGATKAPNIRDPLILGFLIVDVCSRESKHTTKNKDSSTMITNAATKKQNDGDLLIPVALTESIRSRKSERANTKNDNHKQNRTPTPICAIGRQRLQKNRKILIESDSDKSGRDEMSNATDEDTEEKKLGTSNSSIKVHIPRLLVLLSSSVLNSTKQKLTLSLIPSMLDPAKHDLQSSPNQTEPEKDQYLASPSPGDQFATDVKSDDKNNNAVATIERLFFNIERKSSYERLTEKTVYETCKFFIQSTRHISSKDRMALCGIRLGLRLF